MNRGRTLDRISLMLNALSRLHGRGHFVLNGSWSGNAVSFGCIGSKVGLGLAKVVKLFQVGSFTGHPQIAPNWQRKMTLFCSGSLRRSAAVLLICPVGRSGNDRYDVLLELTLLTRNSPSTRSALPEKSHVAASDARRIFTKPRIALSARKTNPSSKTIRTSRSVRLSISETRGGLRQSAHPTMRNRLSFLWYFVSQRGNILPERVFTEPQCHKKHEAPDMGGDER